MPDDLFTWAEQQRDPKLVRDFLAFHSENPHVYQLVCRFALEAIRAGRRHYGMKAIIERARWHTLVETHGDEWRFNNNWTSFYARLFVRDHPEHAGFFELRRAVADGIEERAEA
jgi:hypothetical protein